MILQDKNLNIIITVMVCYNNSNICSLENAAAAEGQGKGQTHPHSAHDATSKHFQKTLADKINKMMLSRGCKCSAQVGH
jgi:hypothetical protein